MSAQFFARLKEHDRLIAQLQQQVAKLERDAQESSVVIDPDMQASAAKVEEMKSALIRQGLDNLALASPPPKRGPGRPRKDAAA